jgi:exopolysaccharide biosynthesis WecB/TagA/CpsF family protein
MIYRGKHPILGVRVSASDYEHATSEIVRAAREGIPLSVAALAVHGVMTGLRDPAHRRRLNGLDLVLPDGQPVRWALNLLHRTVLGDRVRGPQLTLCVARAAAREGLPVYLYGCTEETLTGFAESLRRLFPELVIAGAEPSKFRRLSSQEKLGVIGRIEDSGARMVLVGLGCPRQEVWVYEYRDHLRMPLLAVGAAFSFHAGETGFAPRWMQEAGLEWLHRLAQEPGRLWRRYLLLGPVYLALVFLQALSIASVPVLIPNGTEPQESYG